MYYVYAIYNSSDDKFYIGFTEDIKRRIAEHKSGNTHTTRRYKSKELVFCEWFVSEKDARRREEYLKTTKGKKGLRLILRNTIKENLE